MKKARATRSAFSASASWNFDGSAGVFTVPHWNSTSVRYVIVMRIGVALKSGFTQRQNSKPGLPCLDRSELAGKSTHWTEGQQVRVSNIPHGGLADQKFGSRTSSVRDAVCQDGFLSRFVHFPHLAQKRARYGAPGFAA
jgi:hypothetical protein